jgi:hypothetical protein
MGCPAFMPVMSVADYGQSFIPWPETRKERMGQAKPLSALMTAGASIITYHSRLQTLPLLILLLTFSIIYRTPRGYSNYNKALATPRQIQ